MVISCVAYGCTNWHKAGSVVSINGFPHNNPELLEKWTQAVRCKNWKPSQQTF